MCITVNGEKAIPENIVCTNAVGEAQKVHVANKSDGVVVSLNAYHYGLNKISYDLNTPDGVKHFTYEILKTHIRGSREQFRYRNDLQQNEETEWYANVLPDKQNAEAEPTTIWLSEDENAHVHYGP